MLRAPLLCRVGKGGDIRCSALHGTSHHVGNDMPVAASYSAGVVLGKVCPSSLQEALSSSRGFSHVRPFACGYPLICSRCSQHQGHLQICRMSLQRAYLWGGAQITDDTEASRYQNIWHLASIWDEDEGHVAQWTWIPDIIKERDLLSEASLSSRPAFAPVDHVSSAGDFILEVFQPGLKLPQM